jgi:hypothetical protein
MKICIVGNGGGALKNKNGKFIDLCDEVVRIKNFKTDGFEQYVGSKTTIYSSKWFAWFDRVIHDKPLKFNFLDDVHTLMFMFPDKEESLDFSEYTLLYKQLQLHNELVIGNRDWDAHLHCLNLFNIQDKSIIYFSLKDVEELCINKLKINGRNYIRPGNKIVEPTCGARTVFKILQIYPNAEIFLTGFDCFQSGWYWDHSHRINHGHYYLNELLYFKSLEKMENITFLD